jgi:hypothetical protein
MEGGAGIIPTINAKGINLSAPTLFNGRQHHLRGSNSTFYCSVSHINSNCRIVTSSTDEVITCDAFLQRMRQNPIEVLKQSTDSHSFFHETRAPRADNRWPFHFWMVQGKAPQDWFLELRNARDRIWSEIAPIQQFDQFCLCLNCERCNCEGRLLIPIFEINSTWLF